jgi:hypothetical protein
VGTGAGPIEANQQSATSDTGDNFAISELPFALRYAAERAAEFAEIVFDMEREAEGQDGASQLQARCEAPGERLLRGLPPGIAEATRAEAARMLCYA